MQEIGAIYATSNFYTPDKAIWGPTPNGNFSVKSAYELIKSNNGDRMWGWKDIWKIKVHPRACMFLWILVMGSCLPTSIGLEGVLQMFQFVATLWKTLIMYLDTVSILIYCETTQLTGPTHVPTGSRNQGLNVC